MRKTESETPDRFDGTQNRQWRGIHPVRRKLPPLAFNTVIGRTRPPCAFQRRLKCAVSSGSKLKSQFFNNYEPWLVALRIPRQNSRLTTLHSSSYKSNNNSSLSQPPDFSVVVVLLNLDQWKNRGAESLNSYLLEGHWIELLIKVQEPLFATVLAIVTIPRCRYIFNYQ